MLKHTKIVFLSEDIDPSYFWLKGKYQGCQSIQKGPEVIKEKLRKGKWRTSWMDIAECSQNVVRM